MLHCWCQTREEKVFLTFSEGLFALERPHMNNYSGQVSRKWFHMELQVVRENITDASVKLTLVKPCSACL